MKRRERKRKRNWEEEDEKQEETSRGCRKRRKKGKKRTWMFKSVDDLTLLPLNFHPLVFLFLSFLFHSLFRSRKRNPIVNSMDREWVTGDKMQCPFCKEEMLTEGKTRKKERRDRIRRTWNRRWHQVRDWTLVYFVFFICLQSITSNRFLRHLLVLWRRVKVSMLEWSFCSLSFFHLRLPLSSFLSLSLWYILLSLPPDAW